MLLDMQEFKKFTIDALCILKEKRILREMPQKKKRNTKSTLSYPAALFSFTMYIYYLLILKNCLLINMSILNMHVGVGTGVKRTKRKAVL